MRKLSVIFQFVILLFLSSIPAMSYEIDKSFFYEEESIYQSSEISIDLSIDNSTKNASTAYDTSRKTISRESSLDAEIGAIRKVEKKIFGYWVDAALKYERRHEEQIIRYDSSLTDDTERKLTTDTLKLKEFEGTYEGFLLYDYCDAGVKRYLSEQSPYYFFGQSLFYFERVDSESQGTTLTGTSDGVENNPEILAGGGLGYGKIVDLGSYERILIVQNELLAAGIIQNKFARSTISRLLPLFRRTMDEFNRLEKVQEILEGEGLIDKNQLSLDIAGDIIDAIDEAFDKREYGFEVRVGYLQDLVHGDEDEEKVGRFYAYAKYEKPLTALHQLTLRGDFFKTVSYNSESDQDAVTGTEIQLKSSLSSIWTLNLESILGVDLIYKRDLSEAYTERLAMQSSSDIYLSELEQLFSTDRMVYYPEGAAVKFYGTVEYEITDLLTWQNGISYTLIQPHDDDYDTEKYFEVLSAFIYTLW